MVGTDSLDPLYRLVNVESEQALLGALLVNNRVFEHVVDLVVAEDFAHPIHARLFEAISVRVAAGGRADPAILKAAFDQDPSLTGQLTGAYLAKLVDSVATLVNAPDYARTVADMARRRDLVLAAQDLIADAVDLADHSRSSVSVIEDAEQRLYQIGTWAIHGGPEGIGQIASAAIREVEAAYRAGGAVVVDTGLADVDRIISGMGAGDLVVLGGRPSMGKTALAGNIIWNAARQGKHALFFSLEMTKSELAKRWLAAMTGIETDRQRHGKLDSVDWEKMIQAQGALAALPIAIDDQPRLSVPQMRQRARRHKRRFGLSLIVVDHLQLVRQGGKTENRRLELGDASSSLKAIAKELQVPVLLLSQLSRAVEQREDKRPVLSDLRETGDIEQDADVVMFLYRDEYYLEKVKITKQAREKGDAFAERLCEHEDTLRASRGLAEILIPKNRHGRTGVARVAWAGERQRFDNLAKASWGVDQP